MIQWKIKDKDKVNLSTIKSGQSIDEKNSKRRKYWRAYNENSRKTKN